MSKKQIFKNGFYVVLLICWALFCFIKVPEYQEAQRNKVRAQEKEIWLELHTYEYQITPILDEPEKVVITEQIEDNTEVTADEIEEVDPPKYTDPDLILLAQLIESEGGIESYQCKLYIGSVVLNRMTSDAHPDGLSEVIFEDTPCAQFSVTMPDENGNRPIDCTPSEDSLDAAAELLTYGTQLPEDVLVFYSENCDGGWVTNRKTYTQVDHTIFAYSYSK